MSKIDIDEPVRLSIKSPDLAPLDGLSSRFNIHIYLKSLSDQYQEQL
jgi:hypothetical protein